MRALARDWLARTTAVGLSIGVYDNGQRRFYNFGTTQLDGNRPPTKDTVYEIGAISKTFTGQLLARAMVEGRATLNDEVDKYLRRAIPESHQGRREDAPAAPGEPDFAAGGQHPGPHAGAAVPGEPLAATRMQVIETLHRG